jgi:hypothetical protein
VHKTRIGVFLVIFGAGLGLILLLTAPSWAADGRAALLKDLFRFSVTTVLAGGAALIFTAFQDQKADLDKRTAAELRHAEDRKRRLESFLSDSVETYNELKFTRRELRRDLQGSDPAMLWIDQSRYVQLMRELNRSALKLEEIERALIAQPDHLRVLATGIADKENNKTGLDCIRKAEQYLRVVCKEYENRELGVDPENDRVYVPKTSSVFQYAVSSRNPHRDDSVRQDHFHSLEMLFGKAVLELDKA